tara:strand:- start:23299 stop:23859 length:561 start_codon:yes stop_codon:yes gene_type:complete
MDDQPNNVVSLHGQTAERNQRGYYKAMVEPHLASYDYPGAQIALYGGLPPGHSYNYVSSSFLCGLVNYAGIKTGYMLNRYGLDDCDWESYAQVIEHINTMPHFIDPDADDVVLLGETDTCFWWFWFDRDVSDCNVTRIPRELFRNDFEFFEQCILEHLRENYDGWQHTEDAEPEFYRFKVNGWISW